MTIGKKLSPPPEKLSEFNTGYILLSTRYWRILRAGPELLRELEFFYSKICI